MNTTTGIKLIVQFAKAGRRKSTSRDEGDLNDELTNVLYNLSYILPAMLPGSPSSSSLFQLSRSVILFVKSLLTQVSLVHSLRHPKIKVECKQIEHKSERDDPF